MISPHDHYINTVLINTKASEGLEIVLALNKHSDI